ncbi:hypothetical protein BDZ91DRAFT_732638 [Kalaharituber pfeilii]|nr:hypothetical protein BDZ91DRAFT_732638 [Kalaharituber pfeilii]
MSAFNFRHHTYVTTLFRAPAIHYIQPHQTLRGHKGRQSTWLKGSSFILFIYFSAITVSLFSSWKLNLS